jgi:hypothetical protein
MLAMTDIVIIVLLIIMAANGAYQGFLRSLVGPVSIIISLILTGFIYLGTKNFVATFLTAVLGPFFFGWIIVTALKKWLNCDEAPRLSIISRVGGQIVNLVWGSVVIFLAVAFFAFFPFNQYELAGVSKDVRHSFAFRLIEPIFIDKALHATPLPDPGACDTGLCNVSEQTMETFTADPQIQAIMNDPRVQKLQEDPDAQKAMENKDYAALVNNPVIQELTMDPQFLMKALKAYPKIQALKNLQPSEAAAAANQPAATPATGSTEQPAAASSQVNQSSSN